MLFLSWYNSKWRRVKDLPIKLFLFAGMNFPSTVFNSKLTRPRHFWDSKSLSLTFTPLCTLHSRVGTVSEYLPIRGPKFGCCCCSVLSEAWRLILVFQGTDWRILVQVFENWSKTWSAQYTILASISNTFPARINNFFWKTNRLLESLACGIKVYGIDRAP